MVGNVIKFKVHIYDYGCYTFSWNSVALKLYNILTLLIATNNVYILYSASYINKFARHESEETAMAFKA